MKRMLALGLGLAVAGGLLALGERWARQNERAGSAVIITDPPGLKYALAPDPSAGRGWQEGVPPRPRKPNDVRLIFVGDSVTFGAHVSPLQAWPHLIRQALRVELQVPGRPEPNVDALNFAVNGYDADQVASLLESRVAAWEPDVVVWGTYANDLVPTRLLYGQGDQVPIFVGTELPDDLSFPPAALMLPLLRQSAWMRRWQGARYARVLDGSPEGWRQEDGADAWYATHADRVQQWSEGTGTPVIIVAIPPHVLADPAACPESYHGSSRPCEVGAAQHAAIMRTWQARSLPQVDLLPVFQATGRTHFHPPNVRDPDHPGPEGHAVIANAALPLVRRALKD